jgi:hypothetical protein
MGELPIINALGVVVSLVCLLFALWRARRMLRTQIQINEVLSKRLALLEREREYSHSDA